MVTASVEKKLKKAKKIILKALKKEGADFDFYLVSNKEMEKIRAGLMEREDFKGREANKIANEEMVNVLAFPASKDFPEPDKKKKYLGEIYLNKDYPPFIKRTKTHFFERKTRSSAPERSPKNMAWNVLAPLLIHGFLHLLGYLHWTKRDTIKMQAQEKKLWEAITLLLD